MIVVQIQSPDDGSVSHEVGPWDTKIEAVIWRLGFLERHPDFDPDFIEVKEIEFRLWNPLDREAMAEVEEYWGGA